MSGMVRLFRGDSFAYCNEYEGIEAIICCNLLVKVDPQSESKTLCHIHKDREALIGEF